MSRQNLSEFLAQYSVRSFATFLAEQPTAAARGVGGGGGKGGGGNGKPTPITDHGARGPYVQTAGDDDLTDEQRLQALLAAWGSDNALYDFNGDGIVDGHDLATLLGGWGGEAGGGAQPIGPQIGAGGAPGAGGGQARRPTPVAGLGAGGGQAGRPTQVAGLGAGRAPGAGAARRQRVATLGAPRTGEGSVERERRKFGQVGQASA